MWKSYYRDLQLCFKKRENGKLCKKKMEKETGTNRLLTTRSFSSGSHGEARKPQEIFFSIRES